MLCIVVSYVYQVVRVHGMHAFTRVFFYEFLVWFLVVVAVAVQPTVLPLLDRSIVGISGIPGEFASCIDLFID